METDLRDAPERQRSLRAAFDHSWNLLNKPERETFAALSVFHGSFTRQAAQQVAGASPRELMALVDKSLLHRLAEGRYEVHELLRQYAAEQLAASPDGEPAARDRHSVHYAAALERWAADLKGPRQQEALAEIEDEIEDARAAWGWAVERGQVDQLDQAMEGLGLFYDWHTRYEEGETAFHAAAEAMATAKEALPATPVEKLRTWVNTLSWQGLFAFRWGHADQARECLGQGMDLLDRPPLADRDARRERAYLLGVMGDVENWSGDRREARELYAQSMALYRALGDRWGLAHALNRMARASQGQGAFDQARQFAQEALSLHRALGAPRGIACSLGELGWSLQFMGSFEEAARLERESIALARGTDDRSALAYGLESLAGTLGWQGALAESLSVREECLALWDDLGDTHERAHINGELGLAKASLGHYKDGRRHIEQGLALAREIDDRYGIGANLLWLGLVTLAKERYVEAQQHLQESVAVFRAYGDRSAIICPLAALGGAEGRLGQLTEAREHLCEALRMAAEIRDQLTMMMALPFAALLLADRGEVERAVEVYALASRFPCIANTRLWEDIAGKHIAAVAATLPAAVVAAAQERGQARDLWATVEELLAEWEKT